MEVGTPITRYVRRIYLVTPCIGDVVVVTATAHAIPSAPTIANAIRCGNGTVTFTATNTLGTDEVVEWSTDESTWGNAGTTSPEYNVETGTPITRYARVRNTEAGCVSDAVTLTGTAQAQPTAPTVANANRCGSGNVVFTATNTLGTDEVVEWSTDESTWGNAGTTSPEYNVETGTPITRYARVRNTQTDCASATTTVTGTGNAFPAIPTISLTGSALESSYATGNQWLDGSMDAIDGATDQTFTPTASGTYFVRHTDGNNCSVISEGFAFTATSRLAAGSLAFALYPNPATASFTVQASSPATYHLRIVSTTGEVVRQASFSGTRYTLNTQSLAKGVYSVQLQSSAGNAVQRVVVQ